MIALLLTLFVGLVLALVGLIFFAYSYRQGDYDYTDSLSLLPLEEEKHEAGTSHL